MTSYQLFLSMTVAAMTLANACYQASEEASFDARFFLVLGLIYGLSMWIRSRLYNDSTTFFDLDHRGLHKPKEDLVIFGNRVDDLAEQSKERRVLIELLDFGGHRYRIYIAWTLSLALTIFISFRFGGFFFVSGVVSILTLSAIYFAPFLNQLLIPLFLSFGLATYAFIQGRNPLLVFLFIGYVISFVGALLAFREIDADRANVRRRLKISQFLKSSAVISVALVSLYFIVDFVVPKQSPFTKSSVLNPSAIPKLDVKKPESAAMDTISRNVAEQILKWQEKRGEVKGRPEGSTFVGTSRGTSGGTSGAELPRTLGSQPPSGRESQNAPSSKSGDSPLSQQNGESSVGATDQSSAGRSEKPPSAETSVGTSGKAGKVGTAGRPDDQGRAASSPSPSESPTASSTSPATSSESGSQSSPQSAEASTSSPSGPSATPSAATPSSARPSKAASETSSPAAAATKPLVDREQKIKELQNKVKAPLEILKGLLFLAIAVAILFGLAKFFSSPEKDAEREIRRQMLTQRQKQKLKAILSQIRARNLSPDQEIIETYNALLTVFETGHHSREEWLPAEDFSREIEKVIPTLANDFGGATRRFAVTLYGQKPVAPEELETFRGNVARVLRFFQLA